VLIKQLGGTIKIAEQLGTSLTEEQFLALLLNELKTIQGKIHFGMSLHTEEQSFVQHNPNKLKAWGLFLKKTLKEQKYSVRYVENREQILSSVSVEKNGLTKRGREFLLYVRKDGLYDVAKTIVVQPFEAWGNRDFGRPGRDDVSGMLPPKLALMMINLLQLKKQKNLLDPFCGSGTILTEALQIGYEHVFGSDNSIKAVEDAEKNISWTLKNLSLQEHETRTAKTFLSNVSELSEKLITNNFSSIHGIVTEPYLGKPLTGRETKIVLEQQAAALKTLYLEAFEQFSKILPSGGRVVFIIPRFRFHKEWVRIKCIEEIKKSGFKIVPLLPESEFILYARANQYVGREVWRFEKM
jgi:tRNA G10  N-methylase Trm11